MGYLFVTFITYYLLLWVTGVILKSDTGQEQAERAHRWRPVVAWAYWLVNAPILFTGLLWINSSRWSLSTALLPVWLVLLLLSAILGGVYLYVARWRWPLRVHALLLGLVALLSLLQNEAHILYKQYPFTVKIAYRDYLEQPSFKNYGPSSYPVKELHMTSWGFDYYVGDIELRYPSLYDPRPRPNIAQVEDSIWGRIRSLHLSPDSIQGRLTFSPLKSTGSYNSFTDKVELPKEQVVNVLINSSPEPQKSPKKSY